MTTRLILLSVLFLIQADFASAQAIKDIRFFQMLQGTWTCTETVPVPEGRLMIATWKQTDRYECRLILKDSFIEISGTVTNAVGNGFMEYKRTYRPDSESPNKFLYTHCNSSGYFGEGTVILDPGANTLTDTTVHEEKSKSVTKYRFTDANTLVVSYVQTDAKGAVLHDSVTTHKKEKKLQSREAND